MTRRLMFIFLFLFIALNVFSTLMLLFNIAFIPALTPITSLLGLGFAFAHASLRKSCKDAWTLLVIVFFVSLAFESVGVMTGWVYGPYHYTAKLGYKVFDLVPLLIPVAWFMMMYPSYVIAERIVIASESRFCFISVAALGGLIMTAWDVAMDPMMVAADHWIWDTNGAFFGIPLQNFWGWWLTTFVVFLIYGFISRAPSKPVDARLAVLSYAVTCLSTIAVCLDPDTNLAGPALAGIFAVLPWIVMGWIMEKR